MKFNPGINIGDEITNEEMRTIFQCGNMGGMRRSKRTGTLVIISDETKGLYRDVWKDGILHYTGMGKKGDQVLEGNQNGTLYHSDTNGVEVHLFEVMKKSVYTYRGIVVLADKPYKAQQVDEDKNMRSVWIFPVRSISTEDYDIEEQMEREILGLSNQELVRRSATNTADKEPKVAEKKVYYRDPYLKEIVKRMAEGKCQYCGKEAPFRDKNNKPYLEVHHIKKLADGGEDTIDNVVAICPNCHSKMHILNDQADVFILRSVAEQNLQRLEKMLIFDEGLNKNKNFDRGNKVQL